MLGIFLDTETNGLNPKIHEVLEIALQIVDLLNGKKKASFQTIVKLSKEKWDQSDKESLRVNGFSWEEVSQGMSLSQTSEEIVNLFSSWDIRRKKAVFICQNPSFDRSFFAHLVDPDKQEHLQWPYHWLDLASMYWAIAMTHSKQGKSPLPWEGGYSKDQIAATYHLPSEAKPHRAMNGVEHLILCYEAVVGFPKK